MTALAALLSMTYQGRAVNLNHRVMHAPMSSSPGSAAWRSMPLWPVRGAKAGEAEDVPFTLQPCLPGQVVCRVCGPRTQISNGELLLATETALVFDSSCDGVVVSGMSFYGTTPACFVLA